MHEHGNDRIGKMRGDASGLRWLGRLVVGPPYEIAVRDLPQFRPSAGISFAPVLSRA
jgi:hypothetical protein